jgi:hypothetical protein
MTSLKFDKKIEKGIAEFSVVNPGIIGDDQDLGCDLYKLLENPATVATPYNALIERNGLSRPRNP